MEKVSNVMKIPLGSLYNTCDIINCQPLHQVIKISNNKIIRLSLMQFLQFLWQQGNEKTAKKKKKKKTKKKKKKKKIIKIFEWFLKKKIIFFNII